MVYWEKRHEAPNAEKRSDKTNCEAEMAGLDERKASGESLRPQVRSGGLLKGRECGIRRRTQIENLSPSS